MPFPDFVGAERTATHILDDAVARWGDRTWLVCGDERYGYATMRDRAERLAAGLLSIDVAPGQSFLVMLGNSVDFITTWLGLARIGSMQVPVNTAYRGTMLANIVNDSRAPTILVEAAFLPFLEEVADRLASLRRVVVRGGDAATVPDALRQRFDVLPFEALTRSDLPPVDVPPPRYNDLVAIMYTSGTTGASKGVMISHAHAYQYAAGDNALRLGPDDVYYAPLPFFHIAGQWSVVFNCLIRGATAVIKEKFSVSEFWSDVERFGVTATFMLGAMGSFLYRNAGGEPRRTSLRKVLMSPLIPELDGFREAFGVQVCTSYGSTEVNGCIASTLEPANALTCGRVRADKFEVRLVDENDEEVPTGSVGELVVRPKQPWIVMAGYWNRPEDTARAWRNLWLHSGDLLRRDDDGNFYFVDRVKDAIRRRGENISSTEVENEINADPRVLESAVFPIASEHTEQEVMAAVVLKRGREATAAELIAFLEPRMPAFMLPRYIEFVPELPRTPTGKIQKYALRGRGLGPRTWDRQADMAATEQDNAKT